MKKFFAGKRNIAMMAAVAVAIIVGLWCLIPGESGGGMSLINDSSAAQGGGTGIDDSAIPLSSGAGEGHAGYEYENSSTEDQNSNETTSADTGTTTANAGKYVDPYENSGGSVSENSGGGEQSSPPVTSTEFKVTISIDAVTIGAGYIMPARTVTFKQGETVFDVLYRECRASGIHMASRWTPLYNSAYIEGINNVYEFDNGELSGWMYNVNGEYPKYGCSNYVLSNGDVIEWRYTCDLGRDIGGSNALS